MPKRRALFGAILAIALGIRLYRLDHFSLWLDEILESYWTHGSWRFFWSSLRFDAFHPPLDYLIVRGLVPLRPADWVLKLPAVLWGVGAVACLGILIGRRVDETSGLLAALLLAVAPFHVRYSQELRPHSLGLFLLLLTLVLLEAALERPTPIRLGALFLSSLATIYALYLAGVVLAIAGGSLVALDAFSTEARRRRSARRFLLFSPLFALALYAAYLPWWPVVVEAARRPPMAAAAPLGWARALRTASFFAFAPNDGAPLGRMGAVYLALCAAGLVAAARIPRARFLLVWTLAGFAAIEILGQIHPHYDVTRRFLPAGLALTALAAVGAARLLESSSARPIAAALLLVVLAADAVSLRTYFRNGRADWRPLATFLERTAPARDRIFARNQYQQLSLAYYLAGPDYLERLVGHETTSREVYPLEGAGVDLRTAWRPGETAWLLLLGSGPGVDAMRRWAEPFPKLEFPEAEATTLYRLEPPLRDAAVVREGIDAFIRR